MWQVQFLIATQLEHERQRELERRRQLADVVRDDDASGGPGAGRLRRLVARLSAFVRGAGEVVDSALDRPLIGPHHS